MSRLSIDTAATGIYQWKLPHDDPRQPHLCRLSCVLVAGHDEIASYSQLIQPNGWAITPEAEEKAGVTQEAMLARGVPLVDAVTRFLDLWYNADAIVAHNIDFHRKVMEKATLDCGLGVDLSADHALICTMRRATDVMRLPRMQPGGGYKWPKLSEAYEHFTGHPYPYLNKLGPEEARGLLLARSLHVIHDGILLAEQGAIV